MGTAWNAGSSGHYSNNNRLGYEYIFKVGLKISRHLLVVAGVLRFSVWAWVSGAIILKAARDHWGGQS